MTNRESAFNPDREDCIDTCMECYRVCWEMVQHCLHMGGKHSEWAHLRLLTNCAQICQTSADFMIRGSNLHAATCAACAEVCAGCADACAALAGEDDQMQDCAQMCARCAESCARMAGRRMKCADECMN